MPNSVLPMRFYEKKTHQKTDLNIKSDVATKFGEFFTFFHYLPYLGTCKSQNVLVDSSVDSPQKRATVFCLEHPVSKHRTTRYA